jgi:hypothetical protein
MKRTSSQLLRSILTLCVATGLVALSTANAWADARMSFGTRPSYSTALFAPPLNGSPSSNVGDIVVYSLPAVGSTHPITGDPLPDPNVFPGYTGPRSSSFDVHALVGPAGSHPAAAFGLVMTVDGSGEVTYSVPPIDFGMDPPPNNVPYSANPDFSNLDETSFDLMFGTMDVQSGVTNNQELDLIGAHGTALSDITVNDGDGLATVPIEVAADASGTFNMTFSLSNVYTGFVQSDLSVHTDATAFPHVGGVVVVRESLPGDMNGDGSVDGEDIDGFITTLFDLEGYQADRPWLNALYISDFKVDQSIDGEDIDGFIESLFASSPSAAAAGPTAVPEPSAIVLAILGAAGLGIARLRRRRTAQ